MFNKTIVKHLFLDKKDIKEITRIIHEIQDNNPLCQKNNSLKEHMVTTEILNQKENDTSTMIEYNNLDVIVKDQSSSTEEFEHLLETLSKKIFDTNQKIDFVSYSDSSKNKNIFHALCTIKNPEYTLYDIDDKETFQIKFKEELINDLDKYYASNRYNLYNYPLINKMKTNIYLLPKKIDESLFHYISDHLNINTILLHCNKPDLFAMKEIENDFNNDFTYEFCNRVDHSKKFYLLITLNEFENIYIYLIKDHELNLNKFTSIFKSDFIREPIVHIKKKQFLAEDEKKKILKLSKKELQQYAENLGISLYKNKVMKLKNEILLEILDYFSEPV